MRWAQSSCRHSETGRRRPSVDPFDLSKPTCSGANVPLRAERAPIETGIDTRCRQPAASRSGKRTRGRAWRTARPDRRPGLRRQRRPLVRTPVVREYRGRSARQPMVRLLARSSLRAPPSMSATSLVLIRRIRGEAPEIRGRRSKRRDRTATAAGCPGSRDARRQPRYACSFGDPDIYYKSSKSDKENLFFPVIRPLHAGMRRLLLSSSRLRSDAGDAE